MVGVQLDVPFVEHVVPGAVDVQDAALLSSEEAAELGRNIHIEHAHRAPVRPEREGIVADGVGLEPGHGSCHALRGKGHHDHVGQPVADVVGVKGHDSVDRCGTGIDVKGLPVCGVIVAHVDDAAFQDFRKVHPGDRVSELALVDAVLLLGDLAADAVRQASDAVREKLRLVRTIKHRNHKRHHLGVIMTDVMPVPTTILLTPGPSTGKSPEPLILMS